MRTVLERLALALRARRLLGSGVVLVFAAGCAPVPGQVVPYVQTPPAVVDAMLRLAAVGRDDVVYDLGSGDGRIVIAAARDFGARGVGLEIDPALVARSAENARRAGVSERARFVQQDLFLADLRPATVVTLYLTREINTQLRPKLLAELRPGTRVVSHHYDIEGWPPDRSLRLEVDGRTHTVLLWVIPARRP